MSKPISLITGVGDGTGAALAQRFAEGGYQVAMLARNQSRLQALEHEPEYARGYPCDISDLGALSQVIANIRLEIGPPTILIHNAVSATFKTFLDTSWQEPEDDFRGNTGPENRIPVTNRTSFSVNQRTSQTSCTTLTINRARPGS